MARHAVTVPRQKGVQLPPSFRLVPGVGSFCTAAGTVSELIGRPTTGSTASPKLIGCHRIKVVQNHPRAMRPRLLFLGGCSICLEPLTDSSAKILSCNHAFHGTCVAELRKFGVNQTCPLCRTVLPLGPEKIFDEVTRRFMVVHRLVERGSATWSTLPAWAQKEIDQTIIGWRSAALEGCVPAQRNLGLLYNDGVGVEQSDMEAAKWHKMAAELGNARSQYDLAVMYWNGRGVAQNQVEAVRWYIESAEQGHAPAQCNLGVIYQAGEGVAQSYEEAARWYQKAAD